MLLFSNIKNGWSDAHIPLNNLYKWIVLANVMLGTFMGVLDATIVNVALPDMMSSFGVGISKIEWVVNAYMIAFALMLPTSAWIADKVGNKMLYFIGLFLFTLGSFLCAVSPNENILILSRVIEGFGSGIIQPVGLTIVTREFPPFLRGVALGFWGVAAAASVSFGPLIGGYLVFDFSWKYVFYVNVPIGLFALFSTWFVQREFKIPNENKFDVVGFISISVFLPVLLYALDQGNSASNAEGWNAPYIIVCLFISLIALIVFLYSSFTHSSPLLNLRLFSDRNFAVGCFLSFLFGIAIFGTNLLLPLYLQNSMGYTALQSGMVFLPVGFIQGTLSPVAGRLSDKLNPKIFIISGFLLLALSFHLCSLFSLLTSHSDVMFPLYIRGLALGIMFSPLTSLTLRNISKEKLGDASSILNTMRQLGGSFGVAVLTSLLSVRQTFHTSVFGSMVNENSPKYEKTVENLISYFEYNSGASFYDASQWASRQIISKISSQAYVQAIDDDFYIASLIMLFGSLLVILFRVKRKD